MKKKWFQAGILDALLLNLTGTEATIFIMPKTLWSLQEGNIMARGNHIARFKDNSSWNYEKLSSANGRMYPDEPYLEEKRCG